MDFRILGPLQVRSGDGPVSVGGAKPRAVLAMLLLHANEVVSNDRLIDALWGEQPPETALKALQVHVSQLRKAIGTSVVQTRAPGYVLEVGAGPGRFTIQLAELGAVVTVVDISPKQIDLNREHVTACRLDRAIGRRCELGPRYAATPRERKR